MADPSTELATELAPEATRKRCPYCAEEIKAEAIKCRYCGSAVGADTALTRTWYRTRTGRMIAGVCAGLATEFGISVSVVRLAFVLAVLVGWGMGLVLYLALWVIMPYRDPPMAQPSSRAPST